LQNQKQIELKRGIYCSIQFFDKLAQDLLLCEGPYSPSY